MHVSRKGYLHSNACSSAYNQLSCTLWSVALPADLLSSYGVSNANQCSKASYLEEDNMMSELGSKGVEMEVTQPE